MRQKQKYTDQELVAGCMQNNRQIQEQLYRKYFGSMIAMCLRHTTNREVAMTIVNNGFLRVFKKIDKYSFKGSLEGWIRRIVYHSVSDYFRNKSNTLRFLEIEDRDKPMNSNALDNLYLDDLMAMVDDLPPATKEVFRLYAIEGYTHVEIAKKIEISEGTSKWHLSAARKKLKMMINNQQETQRYAG
jgi:RNA polymerase sigma-70 factor (ECF subfamily)